MPIREYEAFIADWQEEDKATAYRFAHLQAAIMNIPVYGVTRSKFWTASELLGEDAVAPVGSEDALRGALKHAGDLKRKGAI